MGILQELRVWRDRQARTEGVESFRVFPNAVLEAVAGALPGDKEALLTIKGIKDAKYRRYGATILRIVAGQTSDEKATGSSPDRKEPRTGLQESGEQTVEAKEEEKSIDQTLSVSRFLDGLNVELSGMASRVRGEVSSVDVRERVVYFTLKDISDESTLNCLIFRYSYDISGVALAIGDEIVVEGVPEVYKPSGRLSMKVGVIELAGAGALQKAYAALKLKFEQEGLFAPERKRILPEFPERIALITSEQGAAIGDFTMNLGAQGMKVAFYPASVEGKKAVFEIIKAIRYFNRSPEQYDVLVIVRGGGSLESLQAFNNEALAREVAQSQIPTLCGIGHEKDITLAALVADAMVSTPTATARTLCAPWEEARSTLAHTEKNLLQIYERMLLAARHQVEMFSHALILRLDQFSQRFQMLRERFLQHVPRIEFQIRDVRQSVLRSADTLKKQYQHVLDNTFEKITERGETLKRYDPKRALALGYSLIQKEGKILRSVEGVKKGDRLSLRLAKGRLETDVTGVYNE